MKAALAIIALAAAAAAWFFYQGGTRWQDAYRAMEARMPSLVEATVEGEAPKGMPAEKRVHALGSLMRLRYEQIDNEGKPVASYELRALVPPLPYFGREAPGSEYGRIECRSACQAGLKSGGALLERSGRAGIADEWLLRMPAGKPWELGQRGVDVQDIGQERFRSIPVSRLRVTLLEACKAKVRIGAETHLDFHPHAMVPVPKEFRTTHWVQIDGCDEMMKAAPAEESLGPPILKEPPQRLRRSWPDPMPVWEAVHPRRSGGSIGRLTLGIDENWLFKHGRPLAFRMLRTCRWDAPSKNWVKLEYPPEDADLTPRDPAAPGERIAFRFPDRMALYFAEWAEVERDGSNKGRIHSALVPSGAMTCREIDLPPAPPGELVACVPEGMTSVTRLVSDPDKGCQAGAAISAPAPAKK